MTSFEKYCSSLAGNFSQIQITSADARALDSNIASLEALRMILKCRDRGGKLIFIGNGGSAAIASHQAVDFWKNGGIPAIAFNDASLLTCISNDHGYEEVFEKPVEMFAQKLDLLIAISSSGCSKNILRAVDKAKSKGLAVITLSGFKPDNPLRFKGNLNYYVPSSSYGFVEILHLVICHYLADEIMARKEQGTAKKVKAAGVPLTEKVGSHG